jgi:hypothetical protein
MKQLQRGGFEVRGPQRPQKSMRARRAPFPHQPDSQIGLASYSVTLHFLSRDLGRHLAVAAPAGGALARSLALEAEHQAGRGQQQRPFSKSMTISWIQKSSHFSTSGHLLSAIFTTTTTPSAAPRHRPSTSVAQPAPQQRGSDHGPTGLQ